MNMRSVIITTKLGARLAIVKDGSTIVLPQIISLIKRTISVSGGKDFLMGHIFA